METYYYNSLGKVILYACIKKAVKDGDLPINFTDGLLKIKNIAAFGLKNSEWFGLSKGFAL